MWAGGSKVDEDKKTENVYCRLEHHLHECPALAGVRKLWLPLKPDK